MERDPDSGREADREARNGHLAGGSHLPPSRSLSPSAPARGTPRRGWTLPNARASRLAPAETWLPAKSLFWVRREPRSSDDASAHEAAFVSPPLVAPFLRPPSVASGSSPRALRPPPRLSSSPPRRFSPVRRRSVKRCRSRPEPGRRRPRATSTPGTAVTRPGRAARSAPRRLSSSSYPLTAGDVGFRIVPQIAPDGQWALSVNTRPSAVVDGRAPRLPARRRTRSGPVLSGTAQVGQSLPVSTGTWSPDPSSYLYAWHRCNTSGTSCSLSPSSGSTSTYLLTAGDVGFTIVPQVAADGKWAISVNSAPSAVVAAVRPRRRRARP